MSSEIHELKTWPEYYEKIITGEKTFEVRKLDRFFNVGDTLLLQEWSPVRWKENDGYSGRKVERTVTYVMNGGKWGIPEGICIMGITPIDGWQAIAESNRNAKEQACKLVWALTEENKKLKSESPTPPMRLRDVIRELEEDLRSAENCAESWRHEPIVCSDFLKEATILRKLIPKLKSLTDEPTSSLSEKAFAIGTIGDRTISALTTESQPTDEPDAGYSGWISVEDRLPEVGKVVRVKHTHNENPATAWVNHIGEWYCIDSIGNPEDFNQCFNYDYSEKPITHWQQLKQTPAKDEDEK